jgi:hypothetical protein
MTYLPAPYETPQQDDLSATVAAVLTTTVAALTAWVLGSWAYTTIRALLDRFTVNDPPDPTTGQVESAVLAAGWVVAAFFLTLGALLVLFRRGRGAVLFGGFIAAGTTALAQFGFGYGDAGSPVPMENWPLYWGGVVVVVLALLPATGRWVGRIRRARIGQPGVTGTTETGAILWPGT